MLKKLAITMILSFFLISFVPACAPLEPTTAPGIDKDIFKESGLKDRSGKAR